MDVRTSERPLHASPRSVDIDCRGMQCPAPILQVAKAMRQVENQPALLHVYADDADFPADLEAWCRAAKAQLRWSASPEPGVYHGIVAVNGAPVPTRDEPSARGSAPSAVRSAAPPAAPRSVPARRPSASRAPVAPPVATAPPPEPIPRIAPPMIPSAPPLAPPSPTRAPVQAAERAPSPVAEPPTAPPSARPAVEQPASAAEAGNAHYPTLNLQGQPPHLAILALTDTLRDSPHGLRVVSDDPEFRSSLYAWASATRAEVRDVQQWERNFSAMVTLPPDAAAALAPREPSGVFTAPQLPMVQGGPPRENLATLLILHNDLETLLGAMMTANACAAQGMDVVVFFSFWGVNVLRGPNHVTQPEPKGFLQRMMQWMMPKGPRRQRLGKLDMGGMGTAMMQSFMRQQNVMPLEQHLREAIDLGVRFQVCTMSMSVMGIQKSDIMDLPNLEFLGVASFAESARKSAISLTF